MSTHALAQQACVPHRVVRRLESGGPIGTEDLAAICRNLDLVVPPVIQNARVRFAGLLRDRRDLARLSRKELAALAGLSDCTIKFIETVTHPPSRKTCLQLLSVSQLELSWADVAELAGSPPNLPDDGVPETARPVAAQAPTQDEAIPPEAAANSNAHNDSPVLTVTLVVFPDGRIRLAIEPRESDRSVQPRPMEP